MPVEKCPLCGGELQQRLGDFQHIYRGVPINLPEISHLVCTECGEGLVDSFYGKLIEESIDQFCAHRSYAYNDLLSCEQVASLLSVSYQVVTTMLSDGKLPGTKIGREWRVPYGILMEYVQGISSHNLTTSEKDVLQSYLKLKKMFMSVND